MKLYGVLITSIFISGFLIIGYASTSDKNLNSVEKSAKEVVYENKESKTEKLTEKEAVDLVKKYMKEKNMYIPNFVEVDSKSKDIYTIHAYDVITNEEESHVATSGWFEVNVNTGKIKDIMNE
ncbi:MULTISPECIES: hypothetical protein [Paraclostridium]|uniref:PepSY domain-containing protein n=1 Tax=Paraclostridium bifermentans TaxID=1490 RepID=A0A5P3XGY1_PARBF|nr:MULTISPECIES: hypothetical protein [Paraclostridium]MBN8049082.1 hypothetical protein [Paraclostridium bifermentans]MBZ6006442.1 hypothetical protein [Paraclostridium bifermentans]MCE9676531.1 hypothetical protein [Paraclostridium bifermentans]MDU0298158.1 hypothetical protein [Paraclostridium sp. MRS3W1]NME10539.1 hypothetical protein [Paraclostridium bifermentans]